MSLGDIPLDLQAVYIYPPKENNFQSLFSSDDQTAEKTIFQEYLTKSQLRKTIFIEVIQKKSLFSNVKKN